MQQSGFSTVLLAIAMVFGSALLALLVAMIIQPVEIKPNVELPEEYKEMTFSTPIRGEYKNGQVTIEFDHNRDYEIKLSYDSLRVINPDNGKTIYSEPTNWQNATGIQKAIQKDNK